MWCQPNWRWSLNWVSSLDHSCLKYTSSEKWPFFSAPNFHGEFCLAILLQAPAEQTKCPLTQKEMIKPMKSKICGHNYDHDAIMQHISRGRGRAKCPVCGQLLTKTDLEHNTVLEHSIKRKNRRK